METPQLLDQQVSSIPTPPNPGHIRAWRKAGAVHQKLAATGLQVHRHKVLFRTVRRS